MTVLTVRREGPGDVEPIRDVHRAAFGGGEPVEAGLVDALRADAGWLPHLSLVAVRDGELVGHVVATRARVGDVPALGVGPLGVVPAAQGRGVGRALMYALLGAAQARDETIVGLLGEPGVLRAVRVRGGDRRRDHSSGPGVGPVLPGARGRWPVVDRPVPLRGTLRRPGLTAGRPRRVT